VDDGSLTSIEDLHAGYAGPLFVFALRRLGDPRSAEEVVQDTLLRAWRHASRFDPERGSLSSWLFTIARNVTTDRLRRQGARPETPAIVEDVELSVADIDRAIEAWQLAEALHALSPEHREAILTVHYLGFTVHEAADRLDLPEGTVKSRVFYGLKALRLHLEEQGVTG
jgi:RNA polymerase sigma-70 factor (ECF subfamily)